jgi:lipopolysaccharide export LptBFGC system permease protein LptF
MNRKQRRKLLLIMRNIIMLCCGIATCSLFLVQARNATYASIRSKNTADTSVAEKSQNFSDRSDRLLAARNSREKEAGEQTDGVENEGRSHILNDYQRNESGLNLEEYQQQNPEDDSPILSEENGNTEIELEGEDSIQLQEQPFDRNPSGTSNSLAPAKENDPNRNLPDASYQDMVKPSENPGWRSRRELEQQQQ